jgi:hypothetical protein
MYNTKLESTPTIQYKVGYKINGETLYANVNLLPDIVNKFNEGKFSNDDYKYLRWELMKVTQIPSGNLNIETITT